MTSPSWPERLPDLPTRRINHSACEALVNHRRFTAVETSVVVKDSGIAAGDKIEVNRS
jgi:hypothetical protein